MSQEKSVESNKIADIHMHLIPQVDDGCLNDDMAVSMIFMAFLEGIEYIICTPHNDAFDEDAENVITQFKALKKLCREKCPFISLFLGCEIYCRPEKQLMDDILEKLKSGTYPTMNGTKHVLIEFSTKISCEEVDYCLGRLEQAGWVPVIAHIERYLSLFQNSEKRMWFWKERGYLFQMNGCSMTEADNEMIYQNAVFLMEHNLVDFLGTDAHRTNHRPPEIKYSVKQMYKNFDEDYVKQIAYENAERLLKCKAQ